jgi:hypothetical protein
MDKASATQTLGTRTRAVRPLRVATGLGPYRPKQTFDESAENQTKPMSARGGKATRRLGQGVTPPRQACLQNFRRLGAVRSGECQEFEHQLIRHKVAAVIVQIQEGEGFS